MSFSPTQEAIVTLVVVPRERFSYARESIESIYEHTQTPFNLVYVDGNSPPSVQRYLQEQAQSRGWQLIRTEYYLSPNQARNLGLAQVKTKYVVFVDNDVVVSPGWLDALLRCAEETEATVVGPLVCQDRPVHEIVHCAGGESHVWLDNTGDRSRWRLREKMYKQGQPLTKVRDALQRKPTELAEFHCVLVRTEIFQRIGFLDEGMLNTKEHLDFCMSVAQAGGKVYFEPAAIVTYVPASPLALSDLHFYMLRWSDAWTLASLHHFRDKWNLAEDGYFQNKYKKVGWRRKRSVVVPLVRRMMFGRSSRVAEYILIRAERVFNHILTNRHAHRIYRRQQPQGNFLTPQSSITSSTPTLN